jgi:chorismate dehydratase
LVPIAALATIPGLRVLPGCTIASKGRVRSLLLVHRGGQSLESLRSVAADTASRTTLAYARILFHKWGNPGVAFLPMAADLDAMLERADAAIVIGDPALMALEERANRYERSGEELVYHDLAEEWHTLTGLPFVSAVWVPLAGTQDLWRRASAKTSFAPAITDCRTLRRSLPNGRSGWRCRNRPFAPIFPRTFTTFWMKNAWKECGDSFREAADAGVLPPYDFDLASQVGREPASKW